MNVTEKYLKLLRDSNGEVLYYDKKSGSFLFFYFYYQQMRSQIQINKLKYLIVKRNGHSKQSLDPVIQKAVQYAKAITGPFKNLNVVPKDGYMIKIPLSKPVSITNQWLHTTIDEVLILLPLNEKPYIMLYDDENNPHFYYVKGKPGLLLKHMKVKL